MEMIVCLLIYLERYEESLKYSEEAVILDSTNYKLFYNMGISLMKLNEHEKALDCYNKSLDLNPKQFKVLY
jgi:tetratricopeptide (TPR) repeat protein